MTQKQVMDIRTKAEISGAESNEQQRRFIDGAK